jgi:hypothetical protein
MRVALDVAHVDQQVRILLDQRDERTVVDG